MQDEVIADWDHNHRLSSVSFLGDTPIARIKEVDEMEYMVSSLP